MCKTNIVGFGLSLALEVLFIVYKMSCAKKASKPPYSKQTTSHNQNQGGFCNRIISVILFVIQLYEDG